MARHLTRWLKPTLLVAKCLSVRRVYMPAILMNSDSIVEHVSSKIQTRNVEHDEAKDFHRFVDDFNYGEDVAIATLVALLAISKLSAEKTVGDYPQLKCMQKQQICTNYKILRTAGFEKSTIKDNQYLLVGDNTELKQKIKVLEKIDIRIDDGAYLLVLSAKVLAKLERNMKMEASHIPATNRIKYLAEKWNCKASKVCQLLVYNPHVLHLSAPKLLSITELLLESGIMPENIRNDLWAYNYHIYTIEKRIKRAKDLDVSPLKPWVIRCSEDVWEKLEERFTQCKSILKNEITIEQHLSEVFQCDLEAINFLFARAPILWKMNIQKLSTISRLLHSKGYTIADVQCSPLVLQRRYRTIEKRFIEWEKSGKNYRPKLYHLLLREEAFKRACKSQTSDLPK